MRWLNFQCSDALQFIQVPTRIFLRYKYGVSGLLKETPRHPQHTFCDRGLVQKSYVAASSMKFRSNLEWEIIFRQKMIRQWWGRRLLAPMLKFWMAHWLDWLCIRIRAWISSSYKYCFVLFRRGGRSRLVVGLDPCPSCGAALNPSASS